MRSVQCEVCRAAIPLNSEILSKLAVGDAVKFRCPKCNANQEAVYVNTGAGSDQLMHLTTGNEIRFQASGTLQIRGEE